MGGFAIPGWLKLQRKECRYLFLVMQFNRDTERMLMSDLIHDAAAPAGWALIPSPSAKDRRVCLRKQLELVETDWHDLLGLTQGAPQVA